MAPLYKRYIPPKPAGPAPGVVQATPKAVAKVPKPAPPPQEDAPNKRKRERTDEEVAERKAKKLRKKGIDPATVPPPQHSVQKPIRQVQSPPSEVANVQSEGPVFEAKGTFAHEKHAGKRHKLEKKAREQRKLAEKAQQDGHENGTTAAQHPNGSLHVVENAGSGVPAAVASAENEHKDHTTLAQNGTARTLPEGPGPSTSEKREKRKKDRKQSSPSADAPETTQPPSTETLGHEESVSQPKKRRHKLESVLQSTSDDVKDDIKGDQEHLKKHGNILKKFQQSSKLSQNHPHQEAAAENPEEDRPQPILLDLAPLPQPEKAPTPEFVPDPNALPAWISKPTIVSSDDIVPFSSLELDAKNTEHLSKLGFDNALPVQKAVIPILLPPGLPGSQYMPGSESVLPDIAVSAPTGSGKTVAYLLPIIESLRRAAGLGQLKALVVVPTRELVMQVAAVAESLARGTNIKVGMATGSSVFKNEQTRLTRRGRRYDPCGYNKLIMQAHQCNYPADRPVDGTESSDELEQDDVKQEQRIEDAVSGLQDHLPTYESAFDVVVATPGRLLEHLKNTLGFSLSHLEWLVLDEADKLLDLQYDGFLDTINNEILRPRHDDEQDAREQYLRANDLWQEQRERRVRKVVLSATMTKDISKLYELRLQRPQMVVVRGAEQATADVALGVSGAVKESEDGFELPPTLDEYCVPIGDGSEKPLYLVELLRTRILGDFGRNGPGQFDHVGDGVDTSDDEDASSASATSSDVDTNTSSSESEDERESDESADGVENTANLPVLASPPEPSTMHPARAALLPHHNHSKTPTILIFTSSTESTTRLSHLLSHLSPSWAPWIATMTRATPSRSSLPHSDPSKPIMTISTDRAARGLDALGSRAVTHVVQYDVPRSTTGYVHRVGRTARAGRPGEAWTLYAHNEARWFMKEVARTVKIKRRREGVEKVKISAGGEEGRERLAEVVKDMREEVLRGGKGKGR